MLVVQIMSLLIVIQFVIGIQRFVIGLEIEMKILPHSYMVLLLSGKAMPICIWVYLVHQPLQFYGLRPTLAHRIVGAARGNKPSRLGDRD